MGRCTLAKSGLVHLAGSKHRKATDFTV